MEIDPKKKTWWNFLGKDVQELLVQSHILLDLFIKEPGDFTDYSFILFPAAKAYEGFLKGVFLEKGFITEDDYFGKRFRIGKALNPFLEQEARNESVYDKIVESCGGKKLADILWQTWIDCRNSIFHWFPNEKNAISLSEAGLKLEEITDAIGETFRLCKNNFR